MLALDNISNPYSMQLNTFLSGQKTGQIHQLLHFASVDKNITWEKQSIVFTRYSMEFSDFGAGISNSSPGCNITNAHWRARHCLSAVMCPCQVELEEINPRILKSNNSRVPVWSRSRLNYNLNYWTVVSSIIVRNVFLSNVNYLNFNLFQLQLYICNP